VKKILLLVAMAAVLAGCDIPSESGFDIDATRAQIKAECQEYGGKANTIRLSYYVDKRPWTGTCINPNTGNTFDVYVKGVRK